MDLSEICKPYGLNVRDMCDSKNLMDNTGENAVNWNIESDRADRTEGYVSGGIA